MADKNWRVVPVPEWRFVVSQRSRRSNVISSEQTQREKDRLPRGWGRFGTAIDHLIQISDGDETLLATCVTLNPKFQHRSITLAGGLLELASSTNVVLAATDRRLLVVATGAGGAPRSHFEISYAGTTRLRLNG